MRTACYDTVPPGCSQCASKFSMPLATILTRFDIEAHLHRITRPTLESFLAETEDFLWNGDLPDFGLAQRCSRTVDLPSPMPVEHDSDAMRL